MNITFLSVALTLLSLFSLLLPLLSVVPCSLFHIFKGPVDCKSHRLTQPEMCNLMDIFEAVACNDIVLD